MNEKINQLKNFTAFGSPFKIMYLLLTITSFNSLTARSGYMFPFAVAVTVIGAGMLFYRMLHIKEYIYTRYLVFLFAFCVSLIISILLNIKYGISENIQMLVWIFFQFFLLYACNIKEKAIRYRHEFFLISHIFLIYVFISVIAGFFLMFTNMSYSRFAQGLMFRIGFFWGRLFGIYTDPNYGSIYSCVAILLGLYFLSTSKRLIIKIFYILNIILQFLYIVFSDSRTGLICLLFSIPFYICLLNLKYNLFNVKKPSIKKYTSLFLAIVVGCVIFALYIGAKSSYNFLSAQNKTMVASSVASSTNQPHKGTDSTAYQQKQATNTNNIVIENHAKPRVNLLTFSDDTPSIGRPENDTTNNDISNRRFDIWKSGLEIFLKRPLFGVSFRNFIPFCEDVLPSTYIVNNDYTKFASLHNSFIDILASQGIVGIIIVLIFVVLLLKYVFHFFSAFSDKMKTSDYNYAVILLAGISPIAVSMMFYSEVFYMNTVGSFLFWLFLGYLIHFIAEQRKNIIVSTHEGQGCTKQKIALLTFHRAKNFGACLQAFALQTVLLQYYSEVEILDYRPSYIKDSFGLFKKEQLFLRRNNIKKLMMYFIQSIIELPFSIQRESRFLLFMNRLYHLSPKHYDSYKKMQDADFNYNGYVFGSDQIWNPIITKGLDPAFFGLFGTGRKVVYAASVGISDITPYKNKFHRGFESFDHISVREKEAVTMLQPLTEKKIKLAIDPTFLIDVKIWENLAQLDHFHMKKKYILVYALEVNHRLIETVNQLSVQKNLPVVFFGLKNRYHCQAFSKSTAGPIEFLSLVKHAEYIITNSFHGTVFSIIFKKKFLTILHSTSFSRMVNLLADLGLKERIVYDEINISAIDREIDFSYVNEVLNSRKKESLQYLLSALNEGTEQKSHE